MYENIDPQLLNFLFNPMLNLETMQQTRPKSKLITRLLYKIPPLRHFISKDQVRLLLLEKILRGLIYANKNLPLNLFETHERLNEDALDTYLQTLESYFSIIHLDMDENLLNPKQSEHIENRRKQQAFANIEYTNNRISESLELRAEHNFAIVNDKHLWLTYYLIEVYVLIERGLMNPHLTMRTLYISPSAEFEQHLKRYWLTETSEESTNLSDKNTLMQFLDFFQKRGKLSKEIEELLINSLMDKCLSIHADYVPKKMFTHPQYQLLREVVCFSLYLELTALLGQSAISVTQMRCYVSSAALAIIDASLLDKATTLDSVGSFVMRNDNAYLRGPVKLKYGIKKLIKQVLHKDFLSQLGDFFEKDYIVNYVKNLKDPRFLLREGFKAENNAEIDGYDIDFVLEDTQENLYYFIQVKYKSFNLPIYFHEQCWLMKDENFRKGFDKQLLRLKENITKPSIRKKLKGLGLDSAQPENSHYILLHNIPFLNFYELNGVYFYEWNLFRNLLKNGQTQYTKGLKVTQEQLLEKPRFHRPEELIKAFFDNGQYASEMNFEYRLFERTYARFSYDGLEVICKTM
ncbi:hypothetical protein ACCD10_07720 [Pseudomonas sp. Pseusp122]|uniref:hypothetical protein n=1 Tax=unclassified Pseudomonas TaxID=196821 RepID=UPI0039A5ED6D